MTLEELKKNLDIRNRTSTGSSEKMSGERRCQ